MAKKNQPAQTVETVETAAEVAANDAHANFDGKTETTAVAAPVANPFASFKVAKRITMPTLNPGVNQPMALRIMDEFRQSTYRSPEAKNEKPATVCTVTDMETGQIALWLVSEVAYKNISEQYPDASYVGRIFGVQKLPKRPGKRYFDFEIAELEMDE